MKKKFSIICVIITAMIIFSSCSETIEEPVMNNEVNQVKAVKPRLEDDYYGYVNWDFIDSVQIPYGQSQSSVFSLQQDIVDKRIDNLIDEYVGENQKQGSGEQKIKDVYLQYFDEDKRTEVGIEPLMKGINAVENAQTVDEYVNACAFLFFNYGCTGIFSPIGNIDAKDSSKYVPTFSMMNFFGANKENITSSDSAVDSMGKFAEYIFNELDVTEEQARERASNVCIMISDIAYASTDSAALMDAAVSYNPCSHEDLAKLYSNIDTRALLSAYGIEGDTVVVSDISQVKKINEYLTEEHLRTMKDYAILSLFVNYRSSLPPEYQKALDLVGEGVFDKDKSAKELIKSTFQKEISLIYAEKFFDENTKKDINKILDDIKTGMRKCFDESGRLSDDGKKKLNKKLDNIRAFIGDYDKNYKGDYSIVSSDKGGNLLENMITVVTYNTVNLLSRYKSDPKERTGGMVTQEVNAAYDPTRNCITIPAAILSDYFYDPEKPYAYNLGTVGSAIAHEINHAFDSHGYMYDENGCYNVDWFGSEDKEAYKQVQSDMIKYYSSYEIMNVYNVDGELNLSENIADLGGMECLSKILDSKEDKRLLLEGHAFAFAAIESAPDVIAAMCSDEHAPSEARVNALTSTMDIFYEAYDISPSDGMYAAPENRVKVW